MGDNLYFKLHEQSNQAGSVLTRDDKSCTVDRKTTGRMNRFVSKEKSCNPGGHVLELEEQTL